ncbi:ATP-dependent helicase, partial [Streptomyces lasiicapitis]
MHRLSAVTPSEISELSRCSVVFVPGDPGRTGHVAFWRADGDTPPTSASATVGELTVATPGADGIHLGVVPASLLPVGAALPVLTRARTASGAHPTAAFWGSAAMLALQLAARGLLLPGLTDSDHDAWRAGPLSTEDLRRLRDLAAAMPRAAHAVPLDDGPPVRLPEPERLLRQFLDAVADTLPRSPAAVAATGHPAFASPEPQHVPAQRAWATDVAAGHDAGVRISLRVEVPGLVSDTSTETRLPFRAVVQIHSVSDPALGADAALGWG